MYLYDSLDVKELITLCRSRDEDAFAELVRRYTPLMRTRVAKHVSAATGFDELFAEACVGLHSAAMKFDLGQEGVTFGLFAKICIDNRLVDLIRKANGRLKVASDLDEEPAEDEHSNVEEQVMRKEMLEELFSMARRLLSEYEYKVLMLHIQGYKTAAIAKALSRPAKSVDNAKARLFRRLREAFGSVTDI